MTNFHSPFLSSRLFTLLSARRVPVSELSINRLENLATSPGGGTIRAVLDSLDFPTYKVTKPCHFLDEVQRKGEACRLLKNCIIEIHPFQCSKQLCHGLRIMKSVAGIFQVLRL